MTLREKHLLLAALVTLSTALLGVSAEPLEVRSYTPHQFYVEPGVPSQLVWQADGDGDSVRYEIEDIRGKVVERGKARVTDDGETVVTVDLPRGFYYVRFPDVRVPVVARGGRKEFDVPAFSGIAALPRPDGQPDRFFAVHSELAKQYATDPDATRSQRLAKLDSLTRALRRAGIGLVRNRIRPALLNPAPGEWDWQGYRPRHPHHFDDMRKALERHGVQVMSVFALAARWQRRPVDRRRHSPGEKQYAYPTDIGAMADSWRGIHDRWADVISGIEIYNEPSGAVEDRLGPLIHAMAYRFDPDHAKNRPLIGSPGFASGVRERLVTALGRVGALDVMDFLSFHTYAHPEGMESVVSGYRRALGEHGLADLPLRLTESGDKFVGTPFPEPERRTRRASKIVANILEARACGVEHFFAFLYSPAPWHEKGDQHQLLNPDGSPMPSMAAIAHAAILLAHSRYAGDLEDVQDMSRSRVFVRGDRAIAVLMPGGKSRERTGLPFVAEEVYGIDGRRVDGAGSKVISLPDDLVYVVAPREAVMPHVDSEVKAMSLYEIGRKGRQTRRAPGRPVVLQNLPDYERMQSTGNGYNLSGFRDGPLRLQFRIANLSPDEQSVHLTLRLPDWLQSPSSSRTVNVPPRDATTLRWPVTLNRSAPGIFDHVTLRGESNTAQVAPVTLDVVCPRDLRGMLDSFNTVRRVDLTDRDRWSVNRDGRTRVKLSVDESGAQADYEFTHNRAWSWLQLSLQDERLADAAGLVIVIRGTAQPRDKMRFWPKPRFSVVERTGGSYRGGGVPADGQRQVAYLPFDRLRISPFGERDDNEVLDPEQVKTVEIGTWHGTPGEPFTLEVLEAYIVADPK